MAFFVILTVHIYQLPYANYFLIAAFLILTIIGSFIIYSFTRSLTFLSSRIRTISSKNLGVRITVIKSRDEIGELTQSFNDLLDRLDKAFIRERQFIGDVAHEMKTPITTLKSGFEVVLQNERTNEEYKKQIQDSIIDIDRISNTLKNILELAWTEMPHENTRNIFNMSELMEDIYEIAQKLSVKKKIKVTRSIIRNINIKGFHDRLGRAILNIIDNAVKYTPSHGSIHISLEKEKDFAIISIKDTGLGIEKSELDKIFDRFYRGSKTNKIFGAGLGLAIAKATVDLHKGKIKVVSRLNKGSVFFIFLPLSLSS